MKSCPPLTLMVTIYWLTLPWCISQSVFVNKEAEADFKDLDSISRNLQKRSPLQIGGERSRNYDRTKWTSNTQDSITTPTSNSDYINFKNDPASSSHSGNTGSVGNINASWKTFTKNPDEYTIGGVLSARDVEHYFIQVLSVSTHTRGCLKNK